MRPMRVNGVLVSILLATSSLHASEPVNLIQNQGADGEIVGWSSYHEQAETKTGEVWKLGGNGILVCKGSPRGYLYTEKHFTNVVLTLEWRWPPQGKPGNGGILLRKTGLDGIWPKSLEAQLNNGQAGDFWGLVGYPLKGPAERMKTIEHDRFGTLTNVKHTAAREKPAGQWNCCKVELNGGTIRVSINGQMVNEATDCEIVSGPILLTAEGDEIHFRNVLLHDGS